MEKKSNANFILIGTCYESGGHGYCFINVDHIETIETYLQDANLVDGPVERIKIIMSSGKMHISRAEIKDSLLAAMEKCTTVTKCDMSKYIKGNNDDKK